MANKTLKSRISDDLRKQITSGELGPHAVLPSEAELARTYDVSRITVRAALQTLEQEGLIVSRSGVGRIVRSRQPMIYRPQQEHEPRTSDTMDRFMAALTSEGRRPDQSIEIAVEPATSFLAARLRVPEGTALAVRKRVRMIDGEAFNLNDTYHPLDIAQGTAVMNPADIPKGSISVIEDIVGKEVQCIDEFYVRMPTPEETNRLQLTGGTPVLVHYVTGLTADDAVVRVDYFVLPGDRTVLLYERQVPA